MISAVTLGVGAGGQDGNVLKDFREDEDEYRDETKVTITGG